MADAATRCVVTGAASGIGRAVVMRLLADGGEVVAVDRDGHGLAQLADAGAETLEVDLVDGAARARLAEITAPTHLVNAAGVIRLSPIAEVSEEDWDAVFAVNARALFFVTQLVGGALPRAGAVVNVASVAGKTGSTVEAAVYSASKAAVLSLTRSFAHAWARRGVRANAVCPGVVETPMNERVLEGIARARGTSREQVEAARAASIPIGRTSTPEEVASVIRFLLSDDAGYMTGQAVNVDGGLVTW